MDYRKEHNGWPTFQEHWWFLLPMFFLVPILMLIINLPNYSHPRRSVPLGPENCSGDMASDSGSIYWCVLSEPGTNRIQFVLLLPVTTSIGSGGRNWPAGAYDYCDLHIKSNGHQWKFENDLDWKTGVQIVQLRDLTANTTSTLTLDNGRFWQLDDAGHAERLETIDPGTLARIFSQVKTNEINMAKSQAMADD